MNNIDLATHFKPDAIQDAYQKYKKEKTDRFDPSKITIPMGADGITWQDFEHNLSANARNISRRVLNGTYQFYPFREVDIPKPDGGKRTLSIASIRDALVQRQLYEALYKSAETMFAQPKFDKVSFAYRRGKSAPYVANLIWRSFKQSNYTYAFDADIRKFFDTLDHDRLNLLIEDWVGANTIEGKLLWRFIRTDKVPYNSYPHGQGWKKYFMTTKPVRVSRSEGVPQGGVLSGLLANLYLYEFDQWVINELGLQFNIRYYRYADDFVILTRCQQDAREIYGLNGIENGPVTVKLQEIFLKIHPDKTDIKHISSQGLNFVGFEFTNNKVRARPRNIQRFKNRFIVALFKEPSLKSKSKQWQKRLSLTVRFCINPKIVGYEPDICDICGLPKESRRNWAAFFSAVVSDVDQLRQIDRWMRKKVSKYFRDRYRTRLRRKDFRKAGMKSLVGEYYRQRNSQTELCHCIVNLQVSNP